ncbi:MAG: ATP-binding protein [Blautia sp.]|nr:ATP-binding protein [Blautia sp.]
MNEYGLTEKEQRTNLHRYNHALFHNMEFFLDMVWEINLNTETIYIMRDRTDESRAQTEWAYMDFYKEYETLVKESDRELFHSFMELERLQELSNEVSFDLRIWGKEGWQRHRFVMTPAKNGCVYLSSLNLQEEIEAQTEKLRRTNRRLKKSISQEEQFRLASLSGAILIYNINLTRNLIEEEFYEIVDGERYPMLALVGLSAPCSFDEFCRRWSRNKIPEESREVFLQKYNREYMLQAYARGEKEVEMEFDTVIGRGIPLTLRNTALIIQDKSSGELLATVIGKDVSSQRKEERREREALRDAYEMAMQANAVKTDFLSRMSHEMFTPLNAIIGMTSLAKERTEDEQILQCLEAIERAGTEHLHQISRLLDASLLENKMIEQVEQEAVLSRIAEQIVRNEKKEAGEKNITIELDTSSLVNDHVVCDVWRVGQLLQCFVENSIKYTGEGGRIRVSVVECPERHNSYVKYQFIVRDNGDGIRPEDQERIFNPFERVEDSRISRHSGNGLGLYIARNIARMLYGDVKLESTYGRGSVFTATIFLKSCSISEEARTEPERAKSGEEDFSGKRILIVEDNDINAEIAAMLLEVLGCETETAVNGQEAVERVLSTPPGYYDMLLMDIKMPVMDGYEATRAIRGSTRKDLYMLPIVAASANSYPEDVEKSYASGMNGHIAKPLDKELLASAMKKWLL